MDKIQEQTILEALELSNELHRRKATKSFLSYIQYMKADYEVKWFHEQIANYIQEFTEGKIKKLMIFLPPQHGKSELSSRMLPSYLLGRNPNERLAVTSYGYSLATSFNRDIQRYIESPDYKKIFPNTRITYDETERKNVGHTRTSKEFHVIGKRGSLKTTGVGGGLTGITLDKAIIDDPFKDRQEANSLVSRDRVWDWYQDVLTTRLHNHGQILCLFTRWHEDDLAGRILDPENEHYDEKEAKEWTIVALSALKEENKPLPMAEDLPDPREIDEALWPERHAADKYYKRRRQNPMGFASLDQQRPKTLGGNIIKGTWFNFISENQLPFNPDYTATHFIIDGAYTDKAENDATGIIAYNRHDNRLYIRNVVAVRLELNELLKFFPSWAVKNGYNHTSYVRVEPKASGLSLISMLKSGTYGSLNALSIKNRWVRLGKMMRVENSLPTMEMGKVILVRDKWNQLFINQCEAFPNGTHDDLVDCITYAIHEEFIADITSGGVRYRK